MKARPPPNNKDWLLIDDFILLNDDDIIISFEATLLLYKVKGFSEYFLSIFFSLLNIGS